MCMCIRVDATCFGFARSQTLTAKVFKNDIGRIYDEDVLNVSERDRVPSFFASATPHGIVKLSQDED